MPSSRKRIGFLPSEEVQIIIEKICKDKNLSQSKVTGILVEEALKNRGALNSSLNIGYDLDMDCKEKNPTFNNSIESNHNYYIRKNNPSDDIKMINDFIEYKFFKKIMNNNKALN